MKGSIFAVKSVAGLEEEDGVSQRFDPNKKWNHAEQETQGKGEREESDGGSVDLRRARNLRGGEGADYLVVWGEGNEGFRIRVACAGHSTLPGEKHR